MSDATKKKLERAAITVGLIGGVLGLLASLSFFFLVPYRMEAAERDISALQTKETASHDMLVRIDERTAAMKAKIDRMDERIDRLAK